MLDNCLKDFIASVLNCKIDDLPAEYIKSMQALFDVSKDSCCSKSIEINFHKFIGNEASILHNQFNKYYFDILFKHLWLHYSPDNVQPIIPTLLTSAVNHGPPMKILQLLTNCLKLVQSHTQIDLMNHLCKCFFIHRDGIRDVLIEASRDDLSQLDCEDYARCILSFPNYYFKSIKNRSDNSILNDTNSFINAIVRETAFYLKRSELLDRELQILSYMLGMTAFLGYSQQSFNLYSSILILSSEEESQKFLMNYKNVLTKLSDKYFESVISPFFLNSPNPQFIHKCLGDMSSNFLLATLLKKLVFMRYYSDTNVLCNIFGYISLCSSTIMLKEFFISLVKVWSNSSAIRLTDYDQQFYISKAITISFSLLEQSDVEIIECEALSEILPGISAHLESPIESVRYLGMVVGEYLTGRFSFGDNDVKLKFGYYQTDHVKELIRLRNFEWSVSQESNTSVDKQFSDLFISENEDDKVKKCSDKNDNPTTPTTELDSDDDDEDDADFKAMPMSHDLPLTRGKEPKYIRECMDGLLVTSNAKPHELDTFEACMKAAESLIQRHEASAKEVAVEFTRIILHLTEHTRVENFAQKRMSVAYALCIVSPKPVANYLIREFFEPHYSIAQRLDILDILSVAAQKLSQKSTEKALVKHSKDLPTLNQFDKQQSWKSIIESRIEAKTRRFATASKRPIEQMSAFIPYAGDFFFGLMESYDRKTDQTLDLLGQDYLVLSRLVYTLAVIFQSSANAPILQRMTSAFLGFLWVLRWHSEPSVRRAVLFSLCTCFITVPSHFLLPNLSEEVNEWRYWLETGCDKDSDCECRELSCFALIALKDKFESCVKSLVQS